jgi:DNA uptake protein ComE-like DNA-binding protein
MRVLVLVAVVLTMLGCRVVQVGAPAARVDLNSADAATLERLPGLSPEDASRIVANRPYAAKEDLLRRNILTQGQYAAVSDALIVGPPGMPEYLRAVPPQGGTP